MRSSDRFSPVVSRPAVKFIGKLRRGVYGGTKMLLGLVALGVMFGVPATIDAAESQPLSIRVHGDGADATRLPTYEPDTPIAVSVRNADTQRLDSIGLVATGPAGQLLRLQLQAHFEGPYTGSVSLHDEGQWEVRLTSRAGHLTTATTPILLEVHAPPPSFAWVIGLAVGVAIFIVLGGSGFYLLRVALEPRSPKPKPKHAA